MCVQAVENILLRKPAMIIGLMLTMTRPQMVIAQVTGHCSNCHTMHSSQNGAALSSTLFPTLVINDCVGCHSSDTDDTIVNRNGSRVPIVFNTNGYPDKPLAGGNFYWVSQGGAEHDIYGHNVLGISEHDNLLDRAPGSHAPNCTTSCHESFADDLAGGPQWAKGKGGCRGCHQQVRHHGTDPDDGDPETAESGWYRFLGGHSTSDYSSVDRYVTGIEDPDWEQNPDATHHNRYSGTSAFYPSESGLGSQHTITAFCAGCHRDFHSQTEDEFGSPWLRHPADYALPETGEYDGYDPVDEYNPGVPVAWENPTTPDRREAVVMCLSCHRAHGSQYPDMLRWDYSTMLVNDENAAVGTGCFVCHTTKDDDV